MFWIWSRFHEPNARAFAEKPSDYVRILGYNATFLGAVSAAPAADVPVALPTP